MAGQRVALPDLLTPDLAGTRRVVLVGLGGVGGIVARYLTLFLAHAATGECRLVLVDGDEFEPGNASRMAFLEVGGKAATLRDEFLDYLPDTDLVLEAVASYVDHDNVAALLEGADVVILAVDNHATRKLVSEHCAGRRDVVLLSGGNDGVGDDSGGRPRRGTYGNVQVQVRRDGCDVTLPLTAHHPEIAEPRDRLPTDVGCEELRASVPQLLFANLATASAILNAFFLSVSGALHYGELSFDIADGVMSPSPLGAPS